MTWPRPDISDKLVHFTSGADFNAAFSRLLQIVEEGRLLGGSSKIRGGYPCVCFTEAPLASLPRGLVNPAAYSRYSPFGILFDKEWVFEQGGRPVIYQSDAEFELLPESLRWRHMRYEPSRIDFTWEREWRIHCSELRFGPDVAAVVVPSRDWAEALMNQHEHDQDFKVLQYSQVMDEDLAAQYREDFPWRIWILG